MTITPSLVPAFDVVAEVTAPIEVGDTPLGAPRINPDPERPRERAAMSGRLLEGGVDYQLIRADGLAEIHARYIIETDSGARVYVRTPASATARRKRWPGCAGEPVDPALIYFRTVPAVRDCRTRTRVADALDLHLRRRAVSANGGIARLRSDLTLCRLRPG